MSRDSIDAHTSPTTRSRENTANMDPVGPSFVIALLLFSGNRGRKRGGYFVLSILFTSEEVFNQKLAFVDP